jgi:hypothetical protein
LEVPLLFDQYCSILELQDRVTPQPLLSCSLFVSFPTSSTQTSSYAVNSSSEEVPTPVAIIAENQFERLESEALEEEEQQSEVTSEFIDVEPKNNLADHQNLLYLHSLCCRTSGKQCLPYEIFALDYYSIVSEYLLLRESFLTLFGCRMIFPWDNFWKYFVSTLITSVKWRVAEGECLSMNGHLFIMMVTLNFFSL